LLIPASGMQSRRACSDTLVERSGRMVRSTIYPRILQRHPTINSQKSTPTTFAGSTTAYLAYLACSAYLAAQLPPLLLPALRIRASAALLVQEMPKFG